MRSWLRCYLYFVFLICISGNSLAIEVTQKEIGYGTFAYNTICSSPTDLTLCAESKSGGGAEQACLLYLPKLQSQYPTYHYLFTGVSTLSNGVQRCEYQGKIPSNGQKSYQSAQLHKKTGYCPVAEAGPPDTVIFSRQGRWWPQELPDERCFRSCLYNVKAIAEYKHYVYTNGVITQFEYSSGDLASKESFCDPEPEPSRNDQGEVNHDAGCEDAMFKVFCDFVEWYRTDGELPTAPDPEHKQLNLGYIKADHVSTGLPPNTACFDPIEFNFFLPWSRTEVKKEVRFESLCNGIDSFGNFLRALYLLHAALIIFRR